MGTFALFLTISAFAQNGKVVTAGNYLQDYNSPSDANDVKTKGDPRNLEQAAKSIDEAVADPSTSGSGKAWWYRAKIYEAISTCSDPGLHEKYPLASIEMVKSFTKLKDVNDPKFKDWQDVYNYLLVIGNNVFNDGVSAFQKKNYHNAYLFFSAVSDVQDILAAKGQKANTDLALKALGNAGLCAENDNDNAGAIAIYKKMLAMSPDSKTYVALVAVSKRSKDVESAKKYTDEGLAKYPKEKELLIDKINFYMADGKYGDAVTYLQTAAEQDPKNEQIQAALGVAYEQLKDTASARKIYENLLVLNPNSFEGNYGLGGMIFNQTKPIQLKMNDLGTSKDDIKKNEQLKIQRDAIFMQAKPYLEKAAVARPDDPEIKKALNTISAMTSK